MFKTIITYDGTINDIQDRRDLLLITNSLEWIILVTPHLTMMIPMNFSGLCVLVGDGNYEEVHNFELFGSDRYYDLWMINLT